MTVMAYLCVVARFTPELPQSLSLSASGLVFTVDT